MSTSTVTRPLVSEETIGRIGRWMAAVNALVILVAAASSYSGLHALALVGGVHPALAWGFPAIIDGGLAASTISGFYSVLRGHSARIDWTLILLFTGLSIVGNVLHADRNPISVFVFASPPAIFAIVLHRLFHFRQQEIVRAAEQAEAARVAAEREEERQRRAEERAARATVATSAVPVPRRAVEPVQRALRVAQPSVATTTTVTAPRAKVSEALLAEARDIRAAEPGIRAVDLGARLGKSEKTGRNLLRALEAEQDTEPAQSDLAVVG